MSYIPITENKTYNISSGAGIETISYYAGNKNKSSNSVTGNAEKSIINPIIDNTVSWITNCTLSKRDDTAYFIIVEYDENTSSDSRSCTIKLKNNTYTTTNNIIIVQQGKTVSQPDINNITVRINLQSEYDGHNGIYMCPKCQFVCDFQGDSITPALRFITDVNQTYSGSPGECETKDFSNVQLVQPLDISKSTDTFIPSSCTLTNSFSSALVTITTTQNIYTAFIGGNVYQDNPIHFNISGDISFSVTTLTVNIYYQW